MFIGSFTLPRLIPLRVTEPRSVIFIRGGASEKAFCFGASRFFINFYS
jgi:hypothetical protein